MEYEYVVRECRFGSKEGRFFFGVIVCLDFCVYFYRDIYNMNNGSIVVCVWLVFDFESSISICLG